MSERFNENRYEIQIVGCGPAGLGLAVAADRIGRLDDWLKRGVLFLDKASRSNLGSGNLRGLNIRSNSPASDYLETISESGVFAEVVDSEIGRQIEGHRDQILSLLLVAEFLQALRERFERLLHDYPQSKLLSGEEVTHVAANGSDGQGRFIADTTRGQTFYSRNLVLATGGRGKKFYSQYRLRGLPDPVIFEADSILHGEHASEIVRALQESPRDFIAIVGSSHSAWSVANVLYEKVLDKYPLARILILARGPVKVFYESCKAADADGYEYDGGDVCPKTGRINRFGGIRGDAKELYRYAIESAGHFPVHIVDGSEKNAQRVQEILGSAPVIISAVGYEANTVPIYQDGQRIGPKLKANGQVEVDKKCRLFDAHGNLIDGAYALGLAHGVTPDDTLGGEPNFGGTIDGVNLYQGIIGERLLQQIL